MKIVIYGAESTGKTWLAKNLAKKYETVWVREYAREFLQKKYDQTGEVCSYNDLMNIAQGQIKLENQAEASKNNLMFCDTNPLQTYYYGKAYFPDFKHPELWNLAINREYDFYFLTCIDTPWEEDDLRDKPEERVEMHQLFENSLKENNLPYLLLNGSKEERMEKATNKINQLKLLNSYI